MSVVFNIILPILAGLSILAIFYFVMRAFAARSRADHQPYNVGRLVVRQSAQVNLFRALIALIFALFFLALIAIGPRLAAAIPAPTPTPQPTEIPPTAVPPTPLPSPTATFEAMATPTSPVPSATPPPQPTASPTPQPPTAVVTSGVGVYLRAEPSTASEQLQYLEQGTIVILLEGQQTAEELQWQQVQAPDGQTGWVALDFVTPVLPSG